MLDGIPTMKDINDFNRNTRIITPVSQEEVVSNSHERKIWYKSSPCPERHMVKKTVSFNSDGKQSLSLASCQNQQPRFSQLNLEHLDSKTSTRGLTGAVCIGSRWQHSSRAACSFTNHSAQCCRNRKSNCTSAQSHSKRCCNLAHRDAFSDVTARLHDSAQLLKSELKKIFGTSGLMEDGGRSRDVSDRL